MSTQKYYCTHPAPDTSKKVAPAPPKATGPEPSLARERRLGQQAAANRIRARKQPDGSWLVDSQRRGKDGKPLARYRVEVVADLGLVCGCEWGIRYPGDTCGHIAQVKKQIARETSAALREQAAYLRYAEGADSPPPATIADRRALAEAVLHELFAADMVDWASEKGRAA